VNDAAEYVGAVDNGDALDIPIAAADSRCGGADSQDTEIDNLREADSESGRGKGFGHIAAVGGQCHAGHRPQSPVEQSEIDRSVSAVCRPLDGVDTGRREGDGDLYGHQTDRQRDRA
jgi:hypothetical protein